MGNKHPYNHWLFSHRELARFRILSAGSLVHSFIVILNLENPRELWFDILFQFDVWSTTWSSLMLLVTATKSPTENNSSLGHIYEDIATILIKLPGSSFSHAFRQSNSVCHKLALLLAWIFFFFWQVAWIFLGMGMSLLN